MAMRVVVFFAALLLGAGPGAARAEAPVVLAPTDMVDGRSQAEWSKLWWVWLSGFPETGSGPYADRTGAACGEGQSGAVWFLAAVRGPEPVSRTCEMPAGKHVFLPLINLIAFGPQPGSMDCPTMRSAMRLNTDDPDELFFEINGVAVGDMTALKTRRLAPSDCFAVGAFDGSPAKDMTAAANGYYAMLAPLPPGRHTLRFGGRFTMVKQDITYVLDVK